MTRDQIIRKARAIVVEWLRVDPARVTLEADFHHDLDAGDLELFTVVMQIEDAFDIDIFDSEAEGLRTFGQAVDHICKTLAVPVAAQTAGTVPGIEQK